MDARSAMPAMARIVGPHDGVILADPDGARADRFLIDSGHSGGRFSLVEHTLAPRVLAAPLHRHTREDEYSFIVEGRVGALLGDEEIIAEPGDLVFKPRAQWHTFWNAGDTPARLLEIISPGGLEQLFRMLGEPEADYDPDTLPGIAGRYGCQVDFEATMSITERHGLVF